MAPPVVSHINHHLMLTTEGIMQARSIKRCKFENIWVRIRSFARLNYAELARNRYLFAPLTSLSDHFLLTNEFFLCQHAIWTRQVWAGRSAGPPSFH